MPDYLRINSGGELMHYIEEEDEYWANDEDEDFWEDEE
jgi:hypothetical protein